MEQQSIDFPDIPYKVIVLGGGRVGKSSIIQRLILDTFEERHMSTRSRSEYEKTINVPLDYNEELIDFKYAGI